MNLKEATEISKCLSNQTRIQIMEWLKKPESNFPPQEALGHFDYGVCVSFIHKKAGLSQSTISAYLTSMQKCDLLILTRHGKWSYLKRNERTIQEYIQFIS